MPNGTTAPECEALEQPSRRRVARGKKQEQAQTMLEAHEALCEAAPENLFRFKRRSRLSKTRPSSRDAFEVSWPLHHVADSSLRTASARLWPGGFLPPTARARRIRALERSHEEIQVEETLVFDFLHGLGEAFSETIRPT